MWPDCNTEMTTSLTSCLTICQYFWKKKGDIPFGPRDFEGCIWKSARLTSSGVYGSSRELFIVRVTTLSTESRTVSMFTGLAVVNRPWKYCSATMAMCLSQVHHSPFWSSTPCMWFFLCLWLALWWKYLVFLSLAGNQMDLDLCLQKSSS